MNKNIRKGLANVCGAAVVTTVATIPASMVVDSIITIKGCVTPGLHKAARIISGVSGIALATAISTGFVFCATEDDTPEVIVEVKKK